MTFIFTYFYTSSRVLPQIYFIENFIESKDMFILYTEYSLKFNQLLIEAKPSVGSQWSEKQQEWKSSAAQPSAKLEVPKESLKKCGKTSLKINLRYKTEKCRQYYETGQCDYGQRCMFAHGIHELNTEVSRPPKYKTRMCTTFEYHSFCSFGARCAFVHRMADPFDVLEAVLTAAPRLPMPENLSQIVRPEFYPSDILVRKPDREMVREEQLMPSQFIDDSTRLSTFVRLTNSQK